MVEYVTRSESLGTGGSADFVDYNSSLTGNDDKSRQLYYQLKRSIAEADSIDMLVSFLMESGIRLLLSDLQQAVARGVKIRILTGNYLGITQPSALYLIKYQFGDKVDLRFYNDSQRSFHPKAYIFHYSKRQYSEIFIGSSNISRSALTSGIEWNYRLRSYDDTENYQAFYNTFVDLYNHHSLVIDDEELERYSKNWHHPAALKDLQRLDDKANQVAEPIAMYRPRGAQIEALYALKKSRADGAVRALVQAATGIGKTYLAAFDSLDYTRVLFVAHREEILKQAERSFKNIRPQANTGFFCGVQKDLHKDCLFASVETLGKADYLQSCYYEPTYFDYIVIDEFHHAVTKGYQNILRYFKPRFILGLTATPERLDGRNIYEICDYNVPYEISLPEAINKGFLVPFHYYGIYDETDYSDLKLQKGHYLSEDLNTKFLQNTRRYEIIIKHYRKYHSRRAIGFCATREHARAMAKYFSEQGIKAVAVYSNPENDNWVYERRAAIKALERGEIRVIFAVDMFNEGIDIPSVDMVMFLRPTESPTVFLQQLGRGLRLHRGKRFLNVLDFIGNYEKAGLTTRWLSNTTKQIDGTYNPAVETNFPDDCFVDFDIRLIDIFERLANSRLNLATKLQQEFFRIKELLGQVPTLVDMFNYMDDSLYIQCIKNSKLNFFKHYWTFLHELGELSPSEAALYNTIIRDFLAEIATTQMTKVVKMPILMAFCQNGQLKLSITEAEALASWKHFYAQANNWKDLSTYKTYAEFCQASDKKHLARIKDKPVRYLKTGSFFIQSSGSLLAIRQELEPFCKNAQLVAAFTDIIHYRVLDYYKRRYNEEKP